MPGREIRIFRAAAPIDEVRTDTWVAGRETGQDRGLAFEHGGQRLRPRLGGQHTRVLAQLAHRARQQVVGGGRLARFRPFRGRSREGSLGDRGKLHLQGLERALQLGRLAQRGLQPVARGPRALGGGRLDPRWGGWLGRGGQGGLGLRRPRAECQPNAQCRDDQHRHPDQD